MIWPGATEADKTSVLHPPFPLIIPRSSSRQECFHGFSVLNRLCVVPSHALLMTDTDVGVIQVGFGNWEWFSGRNFSSCSNMHFEAEGHWEEIKHERNKNIIHKSRMKMMGKFWRTLEFQSAPYSCGKSKWQAGVKYLKLDGFPYSGRELWLKQMAKVQWYVQDVLLILHMCNEINGGHGIAGHT